MASNPSSNGNDGQKGCKHRTVLATPASAEDYKVGPGRPPREYQFKPGQSGNPKGAKQKPPSIALDLKLALERALNKTVKLKQGEQERMVSMAYHARLDRTGQRRLPEL